MRSHGPDRLCAMTKDLLQYATLSLAPCHPHGARRMVDDSDNYLGIQDGILSPSLS